MINLSKKFTKVFILFLILAFISHSTPIRGSYYSPLELDFSPDYLNSRVIFSGFNSEIMNSLILPNGLLETNVYNSFSQNIIDKTFFISHSFELASNSFDTSFFNYLNISAKPDTLTDADELNKNYQRIYPRQFNYTGRFLSANATLNWLATNYMSFFGNPPIPGYTLLIANMTSLDDSQYPNHWYNETYTDPDSNRAIRKNYMTGYGARDRLYYIDLSSDSYYLQDAKENSTLQEMTLLYDFSTSYGLQRLAEFLTEWIYEIERNLWVQNLSFPPLVPLGDFNTGTHFFFEILLFCNITGYSIEELEWTVNKDQILASVQELFSWMKMDIQVRFLYLADFPILNSVIHQSLVTWGDFKNVTDSKYGIDLSPLYNELYRNSFIYTNSSISSSFYTSHFQLFSFLFDDAMFGIAEKARLEPSIQSISLRDSTNNPLSIISQDFDYLYGENRSNPQKTNGLTNIIIHEIGNQIGIIHPSQFGIIGNFLEDVMSSYTHSNRFSIFSQDNIQRGQIDMLLKVGRSKVLEAFESARNKVYDQSLANFFDEQKNNYDEIREFYSEMNYSQAYHRTREFYQKMLFYDVELSDIQDIRKYTDIIPAMFLFLLVTLTLTVYYRTKTQILVKNQPKRKLLTTDVAENLASKSRDRFIASRKAAKEKIDKIQNQDSSTNHSDK